MFHQPGAPHYASSPPLAIERLSGNPILVRCAPPTTAAVPEATASINPSQNADAAYECLSPVEHRVRAEEAAADTTISASHLQNLQSITQENFSNFTFEPEQRFLPSTSFGTTGGFENYGSADNYYEGQLANNTVFLEEPNSSSPSGSTSRTGVTTIRRLRRRLRAFLAKQEAFRPVPDKVLVLIHAPKGFGGAGSGPEEDSYMDDNYYPEDENNFNEDDFDEDMPDACDSNDLSREQSSRAVDFRAMFGLGGEQEDPAAINNKNGAASAGQKQNQSHRGGGSTFVYDPTPLGFDNQTTNARAVGAGHVHGQPPMNRVPHHNRGPQHQIPPSQPGLGQPPQLRMRVIPRQYHQEVFAKTAILLENTQHIEINVINKKFLFPNSFDLVYDTKEDVVWLTEEQDGDSSHQDDAQNKVDDRDPQDQTGEGAAVAEGKAINPEPIKELPIHELQLVLRSFPDLHVRKMVEQMKDVIDIGGRLQLIRRKSHSVADWESAIYQASLEELNSGEWVMQNLAHLVSPSSTSGMLDNSSGAGKEVEQEPDRERSSDAAQPFTDARIVRLEQNKSDDQHGRFLSCNPNPKYLKGHFPSNKSALQNHPIYNANMNATYIKSLQDQQNNKEPSLLMVLLDLIFRLYQKYHAEPITEEWRVALDRHIVECQCVILLLLDTPMFKDLGCNTSNNRNGGAGTATGSSNNQRPAAPKTESPLHELLRMYYLFSRSTSNFPGSEKYRSLRYFVPLAVRGSPSKPPEHDPAVRHLIFPGQPRNQGPRGAQPAPTPMEQIGLRLGLPGLTAAADDAGQVQGPDELFPRGLVPEVEDVSSSSSEEPNTAELVDPEQRYLKFHERVERKQTNWIFAAFQGILQNPECNAVEMVNRFGQTPLYIAYEIFWDEHASLANSAAHGAGGMAMTPSGIGAGASSNYSLYAIDDYDRYFFAGITSSGSPDSNRHTTSSTSQPRAAGEDHETVGDPSATLENNSGAIFDTHVNIEMFYQMWLRLVEDVDFFKKHPMSTFTRTRSCDADNPRKKIRTGADMFRALVRDGRVKFFEKATFQLMEVLYCQLANSLEQRDWLRLFNDLVMTHAATEEMLYSVMSLPDSDRGNNTLLQLLLLSLSVESFTPHAWQSNTLAVDYGKNVAVFRTNKYKETNKGKSVAEMAKTPAQTSWAMKSTDGTGIISNGGDANTSAVERTEDEQLAFTEAVVSDDDFALLLRRKYIIQKDEEQSIGFFTRESAISFLEQHRMLPETQRSLLDDHDGVSLCELKARLLLALFDSRPFAAATCDGNNEFISSAAFTSSTTGLSSTIVDKIHVARKNRGKTAELSSSTGAAAASDAATRRHSSSRIFVRLGFRPQESAANPVLFPLCAKDDAAELQTILDMEAAAQENGENSPTNYTGHQNYHGAGNKNPGKPKGKAVSQVLVSRTALLLRHRLLPVLVWTLRSGTAKKSDHAGGKNQLEPRPGGGSEDVEMMGGSATDGNYKGSDDGGCRNIFCSPSASAPIAHRNARGENLLHCLLQPKNFTFLHYMVLDRHLGHAFLSLLFTKTPTSLWFTQNTQGITPFAMLLQFVEEQFL
ncbi:unnamed protein product [Amoebophrya sp. A120]|nr:unnamed protein product [Amoebophrya sp. A120]|eukprot:GSA120T00010586001.1